MDLWDVFRVHFLNMSVTEYIFKNVSKNWHDDSIWKYYRHGQPNPDSHSTMRVWIWLPMSVISKENYLYTHSKIMLLFNLYFLGCFLSIWIFAKLAKYFNTTCLVFRTPILKQINFGCNDFSYPFKFFQYLKRVVTIICFR